MEQAFYYHEHYYLLPDGYASVEALRAAAPVTVTALPLLEDNHRPTGCGLNIKKPPAPETEQAVIHR